MCGAYLAACQTTAEHVYELYKEAKAIGKSLPWRVPAGCVRTLVVIVLTRLAVM